MEKIKVKKGAKGKERVLAMSGPDNLLKVVNHSQPLSSRQNVEINIAAGHRIFQRETVIDWGDGTSSTVGEIVDKVDAQRAAAAEKKYH